MPSAKHHRLRSDSPVGLILVVLAAVLCIVAVAEFAGLRVRDMSLRDYGGNLEWEGLQTFAAAGLAFMALSASVAILAGLAFALPRGGALVVFLVFWCAAFAAWSNHNPIFQFGMKVYFHDLILGAILLHFALRWLAAPAGKPLSRSSGEAAVSRPPLTAPLLVFFAMGIFQTFHALKLGVDFNDAFGDFRRAYFYPLFFFAPFFVPTPPKKMARWIAVGFFAAGVVLIFQAGAMVALGKMTRRISTDAAHVLDHFNLVVVSLLAYLGLALFFDSPSNFQGSEKRRRSSIAWWNLPALLSGGASTPAQRLGGLGVFLIATIVVVVGNFRSVWLAYFFGGSVFFFLRPLVQKFQLLLTGVVSFFLLALLIGFLWSVPIGEYNSTLGDEIMTKVERSRDVSRDQNVMWRYRSYSAAIEAWRERPLLGTGLGSKNTFYIVLSDGQPGLSSRHRTHNGYLWLLQTTGVVGLAVFLWLHGTFIATMLRRLRDIRRNGKTPPLYVSALLGYYFAFLFASAFDVILEGGAGIITLMLAMAACLLGTEPSAPQLETDSPDAVPDSAD